VEGNQQQVGDLGLMKKKTIIFWKALEINYKNTQSEIRIKKKSMWPWFGFCDATQVFFFKNAYFPKYSRRAEYLKKYAFLREMI